MEIFFHLLKSALCDGYQAGSEGLGLNTQTANHIANLHLLKLIAPLTLLVHITSDLPDCPASHNFVAPWVLLE